MKMNNKKKYTIAVTGLNAIDSPGPGIAVIKSLRDSQLFDVRIIGLSYETLEPLIYMHDLVDKTYSVPYPKAGQEVLLERFKYINSIENIDFLFPNFDAELFNYIKLEKKFKDDFGINMVLPTISQFEARHKVNLFDYGKEHNILVPFSKIVFSAIEVQEICRSLKFPLVVKGQFYDAQIVNNTEQAVQHFHKISAKWGLPILIQEFVDGVEVNVCGISDGKGTLLGAVPMRKLYITDKGKAWAGVSLDDENLIRITKELVGETKWRGPFELEFIKTKENKYYLLEINPRFPAWCYLTAGCGQNQVEKLLLMGMGNQVEPFENYEVGKLFIRYSSDLIVDIKEYEQISTMGEL